MKHKVGRGKEITNISVEINEVETKKTIAKVNETMLVLWKDKINSPLARLTKKRGLNKIHEIRNERGVVTMDTKYKGS